MTSKSYTVAAVAELCSCSKRQIYDLIAGGKIRAWSIGNGKRGIRITEEEINRWRNESARTSIESTTSSSDGAVAAPLPASQMRALAGARG